MAISQLLLRVASSNLVGRTSKWYFIIKFSLLLSIVLCWREIRPDAGKTTENEFVASPGGGRGTSLCQVYGYVLPTRVDFSLPKIQDRPQILNFYSRTGPTF